jgi:thiosulfate/3-mercaptopyruvate sulfurtransferase
MAVTLDEVERLRLDPAWLLIDARAAPRYRGETEPIDPVAGHIPGAVNFPNQDAVSDDGTFLPPEALRARLLRALGPVPAEHAVCYCGSGVAACQDILALEHAGLSGARLYAGSWSEWCADPARPVATT